MALDALKAANWREIRSEGVKGCQRIEAEKEYKEEEEEKAYEEEEDEEKEYAEEEEKTAATLDALMVAN